MMMKIRCGQCGSTSVDKENVKGRKFSYKDFNAVELSVDLQLHVCQNCSNIITLAGESALIDTSIENSLKNYVNGYINDILQKTKWRQIDMADILGFTAEYLSEIKRGKKIPGLKLFNYLKVLSECKGALECVTEHDLRCKDLIASYKTETKYVGFSTQFFEKFDLPEQIEAADSYEPAALAA